MLALLAVAAGVAVVSRGKGRGRAGGGTLADTTRPFPPASSYDTSADSVRPDSSVAADPADTLATESHLETVTAADSASGDSLFHGRGRCFTCHGGRATGLPSLGPELRDSSWLHGDGSIAFLERTVLEGIAVPRRASIGMPSFASQLSASEARKLAGYVYSLSHRPDSVR